MTMRITMTQTRMGESGSLLTVAGSPYTVSDAFGAAMVGAGFATDTDGALTPPDSHPLRLSSDGTAVVSGDRNLPIQTAASKYGGNYAKALLLLNQSGGPSVLPVDYSGNSTAITFGGNTTTPWANAGYFTSVAAVAQNTALVVPASAVALSLLTDSFLMAFTLNKATPAGVETLCGCTDLSTQPGFNININASGYVGPRLRVNGATVATTYGTHAAADGADHRVMLTWDAPTKTMTAYVDGVSSVVQTAGTVLSTDVVATALALGRATTGDSVAGKFAGFLFCTFAASGLPLNMSELVTLDNTRRRSGITDLSVFF